MPSPFPGMDPYLENPAVFPDLHDALIFGLREAINARLPAPYFARGASRVWMEAASRRVGPDVNVFRRKGNGNASGGIPSEGGVATASKTQARLVIVRVRPEEMRESYLEIYADPGEERLVTSVEVLSITNKTAGSRGRKLYQKKQKEILDSQVHLVEIDLLRGGKHTTAVPRKAAVMQAGPFDYHACIRAFDAPDDFRVYPVSLQERLPAIEIPLLPPDTPISIELQPLLDRAYDSGRYARQVRYDEWAILPPLSAEQAAWAETVLRERTAVTQ